MSGRIFILKPPKKLRKLLYSVGLIWSIALFAPLIFCIPSFVPMWLLVVAALALSAVCGLALRRKYWA